MSEHAPASVPPPASAAAFAPPAATPAPRPLARLGTVLVLVLVVGIVVDLAAVRTGAERINLLDRLIAGEDVPAGELTAADDSYANVGLAQTVMFVLSAVAWLVWFRRAYINVERLAPDGTRWGRGWAIGAWFVPVLNLWRPKQLANDIYRSGELGTPPGVSFRERAVSGWLHLWWVLWVLGNVAARAASRLFDAQTLQQQHGAAVANVGADLLNVAAGVAAVVVVRLLTRRQDAAHAEPATMFG